MRTYWSLSLLAKRIRTTFGLENPEFGTLEAWDIHRYVSMRKAPFVYWLTNVGFNAAQDFVYFPYRKAQELTSYIDNRWTSHSHSIVTNLKRGEWHECDELMLYAMMTLMNDFILNQKAWMEYCSNNKTHNYKLPFWKTMWPFRRFTALNSEEMGLNYLRWEKTLVYGSEMGLDSNDSFYNKPTPQAKAAKELYTLYHWWNYVRPLRLDLYDENYEELKNKLGSDYIQKIAKIDEEYYNEDTDMLSRLVKIRVNLWT